MCIVQHIPTIPIFTAPMLHQRLPPKNHDPEQTSECLAQPGKQRPMLQRRKLPVAVPPEQEEIWKALGA